MGQNQQNNFYKISIGFCLLVTVLVFSACQQRYGRIQKVRVGKTQATKQSISRHKSTITPALSLSQKTSPLNSPLQIDEFIIEPKQAPNIISPLPKKIIAHTAVINFVAISPPDSMVRDSVVKPIPTSSETRFQSGNFEQMFNLATAIALGIFLLSFVVSGVLFFSSFISPGLFALGGSAHVVVWGIWSIVGLLLFWPFTKFFTKFIGKAANSSVRYGKNDYYLGDFKNMPRNVRLKNIFHNLLAMGLLLGPLLLTSIIFPPFLAVFIVFIYLLMPYYLIKFFAILLFSKHD